MKTFRTFKGSWFGAAMVFAVLAGEAIAYEVCTRMGWRNSPVVVAFLAVGLVAVITSVLYEGVDIG